MDIPYIKKIIKLVEHSGIDELELEEEGKKIRVARRRKVGTSDETSESIQSPVTHIVQAPQPVQDVRPAAQEVTAGPQYHEIRSPIVGTFYRAPAPDAEPYVNAGQIVKTGAVLCIVEAMKLMNEIESDCDGTIVKIMAENGKPVEYNQVLFLIEKA
jgi:acetyl-CoA carboxylase biotin carboxyl carrier protein